MTRDEIMQLAADKAVREFSWEGIEWLFQPQSMFELLLRIDLDGMEKKVTDWFFDMSPDAVPHRFRPHYLGVMQQAIEVEKFYRLLKAKAAECRQKETP